ncbi:hypothetical protein AX14_009825 [Amanita brunnescens Koide BX004]|nr:hypothetical protein AX14_009825 [Amanita brunnescens Koide BX004]
MPQSPTSGHIPSVTHDGTKHTLGITTDKDHEGATWYFESLGNDIIRVSHKIDDKTFMFEPGTHTHGAPLDQQCEPNDWIVKETEVKGVYTASPVSHPDLYIASTEEVGFHLSSEKVGWNYIKLDD